MPTRLTALSVARWPNKKIAPATNGSKSANEQVHSNPFIGTSNPRYVRALARLIRGPVTREELDRVVGCSNSPALVSELRALGLDTPCDRFKTKDRDGRTCRPGRYILTDADKRKVREWLRKRGVL